MVSTSSAQSVSYCSLIVQHVDLRPWEGYGRLLHHRSHFSLIFSMKHIECFDLDVILCKRTNKKNSVTLSLQ